MLQSAYIHMVSDGAVGQQLDLHRIPTTMDIASDGTWVIGYEDSTFALYQHNKQSHVSSKESTETFSKLIDKPPNSLIELYFKLKLKIYLCISYILLRHNLKDNYWSTTQERAL